MNDVNIVRGFIQSACDKIWNSCNTRRAVPRKAGSRGRQFSVCSWLYFAAFNVAPAETNIALRMQRTVSCQSGNMRGRKDKTRAWEQVTDVKLQRRKTLKL